MHPVRDCGRIIKTNKKNKFRDQAQDVHSEASTGCSKATSHSLTKDTVLKPVSTASTVHSATMIVLRQYT